MTLVVPTSAEMERLGRAWGSVLHAGDVVVLTGELGAGKTTLSRGIGESLGVETPVSSPTFIVARTHQRTDSSQPPLVHLDAYRVGSLAELDELDIDAAGSIVLAEWAAPFASALSPSWVEVTVERPVGDADSFDEDEPRTVTLAHHGESSDLMDRLTGASEEFRVSRG
ncbi:MAG: hypothetical protein RL187_590 [Actinomycetota bacterium]|jgi:tRNA threonylcarbamoyl adenosine modification protein YjeE